MSPHVDFVPANKYGSIYRSLESHSGSECVEAQEREM